MKTLVIGSGGREHALALALSRDPNVTEVHAAPGNPGMAACATLHAVDAMDGPAVAALATELGVDLVVVGPEAPLVGGVADTVREAGVACFGPSAAAARLEGSKAFAKDVMAAAEVPTAMARVCDTAEEVADALDALRGAVRRQGRRAGCRQGRRGDRGPRGGARARGGLRPRRRSRSTSTVPRSRCSRSPTARPSTRCSRRRTSSEPSTRDQGPNTGGMGAYTPLPWAPDDLVEDVRRRVLEPTVVEMARRGAPFAGLLYAGLALTERGLRVVEFNARFGDPETQALLQRLDSPARRAAARRRRGPAARGRPAGLARGSGRHRRGRRRPATPQSPRRGDVVTGVAEADALEGVDVIHAGTATSGDDLVTAGGRVLAVTAVGDSVADARARAYEGVDLIEIDGAHHRTDIAAGV